MDDFQALEAALLSAACKLDWLKRMAELSVSEEVVFRLGLGDQSGTWVERVQAHWPESREAWRRAETLLEPLRHLIVRTSPAVLGDVRAPSFCELTVAAYRRLGLFTYKVEDPDFSDWWKSTVGPSVVTSALEGINFPVLRGWISVECRNARQLMLAETKPPQPHGPPITKAVLDDIHSHMLGKRVRVRMSRSKPASLPSAVTTPAISDVELNEARKLFELSPKTPRKTVMKQLAIGAAKATAIINIMRREGLCTTRPRTGK